MYLKMLTLIKIVYKYIIVKRIQHLIEGSFAQLSGIGT